MSRHLPLALAASFCFSLAPTHAQCGTWSAITGYASTNGTVNKITVIDPDDAGPIAPRLLVGGSFTAVGTFAASRLAIFDPQTRQWSAVGAGVNGRVNTMLHLGGDDYLLGGAFTSAGGVTANRLARVNIATGVYSPVLNLNASVLSLTRGADGLVYVGGDFTQVNGQPVGRVLRFDPATNVWSGLNSAFINAVYAVIPLANGDVIAGGLFVQAGGPSYAARYSAVTQAWTGLPAPGPIYAMTPLSNGEIGVGGSFTGLVSRFNPAGNFFPTFTSGLTWTGGGPAPIVYAVAQQGDDLLAGGYVNALTNPLRIANGIARFSLVNATSGPVASGVSVGGPPDPVNAIAPLADGRLFLGGGFTSAGNRTTGSFIEIDLATGAYPPIDTRPLAGIAAPLMYSVFPYANGDYGIAGSFFITNTNLMRGIVRYTPASDTYTTLGNGLSVSTSNSAFDAIELADGRTLAVGAFSVPNTTILNLAVFTPSTNVWTYPGVTSASGTLQGRLLRLADNSIIVVGMTVSVPGSPNLSGILRFNPSTNTWTSLGTATAVDALATLPNGDLVLAGNFTTIAGQPIPRAARYSFTTNSWSAFPSPPNGRVTSLLSLPDGDLLFAGAFTAVGSTPAFNAATFDVQTSTWRTGLVESSGVTSVASLARGSDGNIYATATFTQGTSSNNRLARFDPVTHLFAPLSSDSFVPFPFRVYTSPRGVFVIGTPSTPFAGTSVVSPGIAEYIPSAAPVITQQPEDALNTCRRTTVTLSTTVSVNATYEWQLLSPTGFWVSADNLTYFEAGIAQFACTGGATSQLAITTRPTMFANRPFLFRCRITTPCGQLITREVTLTAPTCDCLDFNNNEVFPEDQDVIDFLNVLAGGNCTTCSDIDFNNNGVFPEDQDIIDFFTVLAGGACG